MSVLPAHEIALVLDGQGYLGWTELAVETSIDAMSGQFDLTLATRERTGAAEWPIVEGAACEIMLAGRALITGWIDAVERSIEAEFIGLHVRGRDRTADLVDCSAVHQPGSWRGRKLSQIAAELLAPFGIGLTMRGDEGAAFTRFALQQGETVFAAIERMARYRGLALWSPGDGTLAIGNPDSGVRTGMVKLGHNVIRANANRDLTDRFSTYLLKGQASGSDQRNGEAAAHVRGEATDPGVRRYRPMLLVGEEQADPAALKRRAAWEAAVRAGRGESLSATVPGWLTDAGQPWLAGGRADCQLPTLKVVGDLLVERVRFIRDEERGSVTELSLVPPQAWTQLAEPEETPS